MYVKSGVSALQALLARCPICFFWAFFFLKKKVTCSAVLTCRCSQFGKVWQLCKRPFNDCVLDTLVQIVPSVQVDWGGSSSSGSVGSERRVKGWFAAGTFAFSMWVSS